MNAPVLVFDIETKTDLTAGAYLHQLSGLSAESTEMALNKLRRQESGMDFPRLPLHEIVTISGLWSDEQGIRLFSFSQQDHSEAELLSKFLSIFDKRRPILVSWNGTQFDLPVILFRSMYYGLSAPALFDQGEIDQRTRYNNYQNRYHHRHLDLMDAMSVFNNKNFQKLDTIARLLGYPGKMGREQYRIPEYIASENWQQITADCETDVLNTWCIYLRWLLLKGQISLSQHQAWIEQTKTYLQTQPQHEQFLQDWQQMQSQLVVSAQQN